MDLNKLFILMNDKFRHTVKIRRYGHIDTFLIIGFIAIFLILFKYYNSYSSLLAIIYIFIYYERVDFLISESLHEVSSAISAIFFGVISIVGILLFLLWLFLVFKIPVHWSFATLILIAYPVFSASSRLLRSSCEFLKRLK